MVLNPHSDTWQMWSSTVIGCFYPKSFRFSNLVFTGVIIKKEMERHVVEFDPHHDHSQSPRLASTGSGEYQNAAVSIAYTTHELPRASVAAMYTHAPAAPMAVDMVPKEEAQQVWYSGPPFQSVGAAMPQIQLSILSMPRAIYCWCTCTPVPAIELHFTIGTCGKMLLCVWVAVCWGTSDLQPQQIYIYFVTFYNII